MINPKREVDNLIKKSIRKYIDNNHYLFFTDNIYTVNCHLKPRLISSAVEQGFSACKKKKLLDGFDNDSLKEISSKSMLYALDYINNKGTDKSKKEEKNGLSGV